MFPPFPEGEAFLECEKIVKMLSNKTIFLKRVAKESEERKNQGVMLGVLICKKPNGKKIVLKTVSGLLWTLNFQNGRKCNNFVMPIVSTKKINAALKKNDKAIHELTDKINEMLVISSPLNHRPTLETLKMARAKLTNESLLKVYSLYEFFCADGKKRKLLDICKKTLPPTGTGDCCAPKLLNYAFSHHFLPLSMAEVFVDTSYQIGESVVFPRLRSGQAIAQRPMFNRQRSTHNLQSPCDARCGLILPIMLGLKIIYRDDDIIVIEKESGVLSVPGRGEEKQDCVSNRIRRLFPACILQPAVHRLDMETSGLMVFALTKEAHKKLNAQFENRQVEKEYVALLDGILKKSEGQCELYFRCDIENRPHQIWDEVNGKKAVTQWREIRKENYISPDGKKRTATRVLFVPLTGRTHQLRLATSDKRGLGVPIIGDTLYGKCDKGERLMLHATKLSFFHPKTGEKMTFVSETPF